ncbi:MAG: Peroxide operon regulator [Desulfovibrio sp.]
MEERQTRNTKQRTVILEKLRQVYTHPTADEIYAMTREELPRISLGTVYRNLEVLARQGEILCLENGAAQKRFDGNTLPHHHIRCVQCGKIADVHINLPAPSIETATVDGFTVTGAQILFEGVCDKCKM